MKDNTQNINTELFVSQEDMREKTSALKTGWSKKKTFDTLGVSSDKFETMNVTEIQASIYGNSQVQGSPEQLERFRTKLMSYEGYMLPYRMIESSSSIGFGKMKVEKKGYDLLLILIFEKGRLIKAFVEGTQDVNQKEDQYLWNSLLKSGVKAAF